MISPMCGAACGLVDGGSKGERSGPLARPNVAHWVDWLPANSGSGASPADALEAAAEDTGRTVLEGEVRVVGDGHIGGLEGRVRRNPVGADGV